MIPLALFSDAVPKPDLQCLAEQLLAARPSDDEAIPKDRYGTRFGKPSFPHSISDSTQLADLVTSDSWFIFRLLKMDDEFLRINISSWQSHPSFLSSKQKIEALNVVNDSDERGVKLSSDFLNDARLEEHYQNVLQVVQTDRKETPNLRKHTCRAARDK